MTPGDLAAILLIQGQFVKGALVDGIKMACLSIGHGNATPPGGVQTMQGRSQMKRSDKPDTNTSNSK